MVAGLFVGWEWNVVRFVLIALAFIQLVTEFAKQRQLETVDPESLRSRDTVPNRLPIWLLS